MSDEQDQNDSTSLATTADPGAEMAELLEGLQWEVCFDHSDYAPAFPAVVTDAATEVRRLGWELLAGRNGDGAELMPEHEKARARLLAACQGWDGAADALPLLRRMRSHYVDYEQSIRPPYQWKFLDAMKLLLDGGWAAAGIEALFTAELGPLPDDLRAALAQLGKGQKEGDETAIATARLWIDTLLPDHLRETRPIEEEGEA